MKEKLLIHTVNEAYSFHPEQIICIEADGNYCNLHLSNGNEYLLSFQLGQVESIIKEQLSYSNHSFVRVGKSLIINMDDFIFFGDAVSQEDVSKLAEYYGMN